MPLRFHIGSEGRDKICACVYKLSFARDDIKLQQNFNTTHDEWRQFWLESSW